MVRARVSGILRNAIQCTHCGKIIESRHRHDYVSHECKRPDGTPTEIAADCGKDYLRRMYTDNGDYVERSEYFAGGVK